jgi:hypothetical protein
LNQVEKFRVPLTRLVDDLVEEVLSTGHGGHGSRMPPANARRQGLRRARSPARSLCTPYRRTTSPANSRRDFARRRAIDQPVRASSVREQVLSLWERDRMRTAVDRLRKLLLPLGHCAVGGDDDVVLEDGAVDRDRAELGSRRCAAWVVVWMRKTGCRRASVARSSSEAWGDTSKKGWTTRTRRRYSRSTGAQRTLRR